MAEVLLLHLDGLDEATSTIDSSPSNHTINFVGTAQLDTAQKKFDESSILLDGNSDYLSIPNHTDWNLGSGDFTIDTWIRFNSTAGSQGIFTRETSGLSYFYIAYEGTGIRFRDYGGTYDSSFIWSRVADTWYHFEIGRSGSSIRCFIDGNQIGTTQTFAGAFIDRTVPLYIGAFPLANYWFNGWMDEAHILKGECLHTSNFTPPVSPYGDQDQTLDITETVNLSDDWTFRTNPESLEMDEVVELSDDWTFRTNPEFFVIDETINISDSWTLQAQGSASFVSKIISYNPLIFVTDSDPVRIVKVDVTVPETPTWDVYELLGITNAKSVTYNSSNESIYVACAGGKLVKIPVNDLNSPTTIDLSDMDNLLTVDVLDNFFISYAGTNNTIGELYLIDERDAVLINNDFKYLRQNWELINNEFHYLSAQCKIINNDFKYLETKSTLINNDFKYLATVFNEITAVAQTDFHVFIDSVELGNTDIDLTSISINHTIDQQSQVTFKLNRRHDNINKTLAGSTVTITNQNAVRIDIKNRTGEFDGKISNINAIGERGSESVLITALMDQPSEQYNTVNLPLASLDERFNLYHVKAENLNIYNPYIDPDNEVDPPLYKGIRVDLGKEIKQCISRWMTYDYGRDPFDPASVDKYADQIQKGEFNPWQNWTYFWFPTVRSFIGGKVHWFYTQTYTGYIGTSLSPVSSDVWTLECATHRMQRQWDNKERELGNYEVGSAPFKDVSVKNGKYLTKSKWVDKSNGFYIVKDAGYNFVGTKYPYGWSKGYAQKVADLEYDKITNINGDILPQTSLDINLTVDAYLYYNLKLLTRINIENTIEANTYKNNNGFPVSVKSIQINSADLSVSFNTDNLKSTIELEDLDGQYPDEESDEYKFSASSSMHTHKFDINKYTKVE